MERRVFQVFLEGLFLNEELAIFEHHSSILQENVFKCVLPGKISGQIGNQTGHKD
jgi:hypothetical protein